jgi:hypothetical protein
VLAPSEQEQSKRLKSIVRAILEAAEETGALDEEALAALPPMVADQLRAAWAGRSGYSRGSSKTRSAWFVV